MLESENNLQSKHKEVVCPAISKLAGDGTIVSLQAVIAYLEDYIVQSSDPNATINAIQGSWTKRIIACGKLLNVSIEKRNVNWKSIASRLQHLAGNNIVNDTASSIVSSDVSTTTTSSSCTVLKHLLTELDKNAIKQMFDQLDKSKCWILESTRQLAVDQQCELESVEQKMRRFALSCEYAHPCHSLILDLCDQHWQDVFKSEELEELFAFGKPILRSQPKELDDLLDQLEKLTSASDAYKFVQRLDYDVEKEQLKAWLATTLMSTARLFIHSKNKNVLDLMETDKLYLLWGFINSVFWDSPVQAISKEKGSMANADARNRKRLLSAMKQTPNAKQGHKMDTIYLAGDNELGCLEISGTNDTSKAMKDGQIKMPIVMKDMLLRIAKTTNARLIDIRILGYNISGNRITLTVLDAPHGDVVRFRRMNELMCPSSVNDFVQCMIPLLELAMLGRSIVEETLHAIDHAPRRHLTFQNPTDTSVLPPCFIPTSPSISSSSSSSSSKKQKQSA